MIAGQQVEGLRTIDESLYRPEETWWLPEQLRLRAELLLLAPGNEDEAEDQLCQAVALARDHGSKSLELRVAVRLARLWQAWGRVQEAKALLGATCGWFTEGLTNQELGEARALMASGAR